MVAVVEREVLAPPAEPVVSEDPAAVYEFDDAFQGKVAALCLRDGNFLQRTEGLIRPEYFENVVDAHLVSIATRYYEKYRQKPGDVATLVSLVKEDVANKVIRKETMPLMAPRIKELMTCDVSDRDYVIDQVSNFARYQAVAKAVLDSVEHLSLRNFDKIQNIVQKALSVGASADVASYDYGEMIESRTEKRLDRVSGKAAPTGITTGYAEIDKYLYHHGWGKRELSVLMGPAKSGKTTALMGFGISAAAHLYRYNVLYVTLEVSAEIIADRMDACIADQVMFELDGSVHDVKAKVSEWKKKAGRFVIQEFPSGTMKVSDLRRVINKHKADGLIFDLIIVDYADLMAPERYTDNAIENSKNVYVNLRGLAMEEDVAMLTATQTNREGAKKMVATMTDVADDFNKVRIADIIISINRTEEERAVNQARLYFAAVRNGKGGFSVRIEQDTDRMKFIKSVLGEE
ncbi:AAA family ATPase [Oxalobacter sp. OttesenSCG-928-P03]|nr:AAA family ATPase [Oxalobacter sp. OttesenSCG-928-P03]